MGCGGASYQASGGVKFDIDGAGREIDDTDVAKAFEARPQISERVRIAYYTFDGNPPPANPVQAAAVKDNPQAIGWFVGQVMKETGGKANPGTVNQLLRAKLGV